MSPVFETESNGLLQAVPGAVTVSDGGGNSTSARPAALFPRRPQTPTSVHAFRAGAIRDAHSFVAPLQHTHTHTQGHVAKTFDKDERRQNVLVNLTHFVGFVEENHNFGQDESKSQGAFIFFPLSKNV